MELIHYKYQVKSHRSSKLQREDAVRKNIDYTKDISKTEKNLLGKRVVIVKKTAFSEDHNIYK